MSVYMNKRVNLIVGFKFSCMAVDCVNSIHTHTRVRAKMNFACKQVVQTHGGLYTQVNDIACTCVFMTKMRVCNAHGPCVCHACHV